VAYDVDRQPGEWVGRQARRHSRGVLFLVAALALTSLVSLLLAVSPARTLLGCLAVLAVVALLKVVGDRKVDMAVRWRKGWAAEKSVGEELNRLRSNGFVVMHDVPQRGEVNIDHIVSGPTGVYLIETKARSYQDNQLLKARRQAAKLHFELGAWVTPVICLDNRDGTPFRHDRVWIVPRQHIIDWIRARRTPKLCLSGLLGAPTRSDGFASDPSPAGDRHPSPQTRLVRSRCDHEVGAEANVVLRSRR
jgi:hypothetical protein